MALKFAGIAQAGDYIKAYDFEPFPGRTERYIVGRVLNACVVMNGSHFFKVMCTEDTLYDEGVGRVGEVVFVPHQVTFLEYDNRIQKV